MGLELSVEKKKETAAYCVYAFGAPTEPGGRVRVDKASGDIELLTVPDSDEAPNEKYFLARLVPRLHTYHDRDVYPDRDHWEV